MTIDAMTVLQLADYQIFVGNFWSEFKAFLQQKNYTQTLVLVDENTEGACLERFRSHFPEKIHVISISSGEVNKTIETCHLKYNNAINHGAESCMSERETLYTFPE